MVFGTIAPNVVPVNLIGFNGTNVSLVSRVIALVTIVDAVAVGVTSDSDIETQQLKSKEELDTITNTTMKYSDEDTLNVFTGNGKNERNNWVNKWKDKCKTIPGYGVYRHTYLDVEHLLPKHLLDEINLIKEYDYAQYRVEYLGEYGMSASSIYKKFNYDDVAIEEIDNNDINVILGGCDYGDSDAFVCTASGISANFDKVQVIDTFYHKNGVSPMMKDVNDYVKDFFDFYEEISLNES